jgi:hypothetical protein
MEDKYKIIVNERQLGILTAACEILGRLGLGQWRDAIERLPLKDFKEMNWSEYHEDLNTIGQILSKHMKNNIDGYRSSFGVGSDKTPKGTDEAFDLMEVFRHRLSHDRADEKGIYERHTRQYDKPFKWGEEPLATIEKVEEVKE